MLDRCIADNNWCNMFPYVEVIHFPICHSDNGVMLLKYGERSDKRHQGRLFRFEAIWLFSDNCNKVESDAWLVGVVSLFTHALSTWHNLFLHELQRHLGMFGREIEMLNDN